MAYEMVMPYHLHMPSYFLETFTEYPYHTVNYYRLRQWTVQSTARVYTVHYIRLYKPPQETIVHNHKKELNHKVKQG